MAERLSADAWTDAALRVLADDGVEAVRVEPLGRALGVTKGSFYWHFANRRALLDAALERWEEAATEAVITRVETAAAEPAERLRVLTRLAFDKGGSLDRAVRAWAIEDEVAARTVERVDARRVRFVEKLFEGHGHGRAAAAQRARMLYSALVGEAHLSVAIGRRRRVAWALANLELLLT